MKRAGIGFFRPVRGPARLRARGAAVVEFAVVLPLLLLILFGIIEYGWIFMVRQTLTSAAREGCRVAVLQTATPDLVSARVSDVMDPTGYPEGVWQFTTSDIDDEIQWVTVSIPLDAISLTGFFGTRDSDIEGTCSMRKEGVAIGG